MQKRAKALLFAEFFRTLCVFALFRFVSINFRGLHNLFVGKKTCFVRLSYPRPLRLFCSNMTLHANFWVRIPSFSFFLTHTHSLSDLYPCHTRQFLGKFWARSLSFEAHSYPIFMATRLHMDMPSLSFGQYYVFSKVPLPKHTRTLPACAPYSRVRSSFRLIANLLIPSSSAAFVTLLLHFFNACSM